MPPERQDGRSSVLTVQLLELTASGVPTLDLSQSPPLCVGAKGQRMAVNIMGALKGWCKILHMSSLICLQCCSVCKCRRW